MTNIYREQTFIEKNKTALGLLAAGVCILVASSLLIHHAAEKVFEEMKRPGSPTYERAMTILVDDVERQVDIRQMATVQSMIGCLCHEGISLKREKP